MANYKDIDTYAKQWVMWRSLSAPVWVSTTNADPKSGRKKRAGKIDEMTFRNAYAEADIDLLTKGTPLLTLLDKGFKAQEPLSIGRINSHLTGLKKHIKELGRQNGVSEDALANWEANVKLCYLKEGTKPIDGLIIDEAFFGDL